MVHKLRGQLFVTGAENISLKVRTLRDSRKSGKFLYNGPLKTKFSDTYQERNINSVMPYHYGLIST